MARMKLLPLPPRTFQPMGYDERFGLEPWDHNARSNLDTSGASEWNNRGTSIPILLSALASSNLRLVLVLVLHLGTTIVILVVNHSGYVMLNENQ
jgi:hypothetical protein